MHALHKEELLAELWKSPAQRENRELGGSDDLMTEWEFLKSLWNSSRIALYVRSCWLFLQRWCSLWKVVLSSVPHWTSRSLRFTIPFLSFLNRWKLSHEAVSSTSDWEGEGSLTSPQKPWRAMTSTVQSLRFPLLPHEPDQDRTHSCDQEIERHYQVVPSVVCAMCCLFGIIYCFFGECLVSVLLGRMTYRFLQIYRRQLKAQHVDSMGMYYFSVLLGHFNGPSHLQPAMQHDKLNWSKGKEQMCCISSLTHT